MPANGARGEATAVLAGHERRLCLTLGAMAEMETGLAVSGLDALAQRMRTLSATDLIVVLGALLRGAGDMAFADRLALEPVALNEAAAAIGAAFAASVEAGGAA